MWRKNKQKSIVFIILTITSLFFSGCINTDTYPIYYYDFATTYTQKYNLTFNGTLSINTFGEIIVDDYDRGEITINPTWFNNTSKSYSDAVYWVIQGDIVRIEPTEINIKQHHLK